MSEESLELELFDAATAVDRDAEFTAFIGSGMHALHRTAFLLCGDAHRADELTQDALERTYRAWDRARVGDPLAYARRVLVNRRIDTWRRTRREVLTSPDELPDGPATWGAPDGGDGDHLLRAVLALPVKQRRVVVLRYMEDLSEEQVATELGIPRGTVKSTASRGLAALRLTLATAGERSAL